MNMKKFFLIIFLLSGLFVSAQSIEDKDVPSAIKTKFISQYSDITNVSWGKINISNYEAEFENNGVETSVLFDIKGIIVETVNELKITELPKSVIDYINKNYSWKRIKHIVKITETTGKIYYRVGVGVRTVELVFDYQGNFVRLAKSF